MGDLGKLAKIGHFKLRIGNDFQVDAAGVSVDGGFNGLEVSEVNESGFNAEPGEGRVNQGEGIAEDMARGYDVFSGGGHGHERIGDGGHSGIEGKDSLSAGEGLDLVFEMIDRGVRNS